MAEAAYGLRLANQSRITSESSQSESEWAMFLGPGLGDQGFVGSILRKGDGAFEGADHGKQFLGCGVFGHHGCGLRYGGMVTAELIPCLADDGDGCGGEPMGVAIDLCEERVREFDGFAHVGKWMMVLVLPGMVWRLARKGWGFNANGGGVAG